MDLLQIDLSIWMYMRKQTKIVSRLECTNSTKSKIEHQKQIIKIKENLSNQQFSFGIDCAVCLLQALL